MRVLVTGASGLLGFRVARLAARAHSVVAAYSTTPVELAGAETVRLDVLDRESVFRAVKSADPDTIIHCAAMAGVDDCERFPEKAVAVNGTGTESLAMAARNVGAKLAYVSTDYVFDGKKQGAYTELDAPNPINSYGRSKLRGEFAARLAGNYAVARTSVLFGWNLCGSRENFYAKMVGALKRGEQVQLDTSSIVTPTFVENAAEGLVRIGESGARGLFHVSGGVAMNRFEFGLLAARVFGFDESLITPSTPGEFGWLAKRPENSALSAEKAERELGLKPVPPKEGWMRMKQELEMASPGGWRL
ncbi:MAG: SDR family oxidoreductase [Candidatus ainarchaeum sp.]|nr:SDR family oxidoreductase [Candidatus ainarchaeum sp.]